METTAYIALSRQVVLRHRMDVIAHNVANMNTTGFKAEAVVLEPVLEDAGRRSEVAFVQDFATVRDLSPGPILTTHDPLDLAIDGDGYFVVETEGGTRYSRSGQFQLNALGELVTASGDRVLGAGGDGIIVPAESGTVVVGADGTVSTPDGVLGRVEVVTFADVQGLERSGSGYYRTDQIPVAPPATTRIVQGALESSNVRPVVEMTEMISTSRAYQSTQRLIEAHHEAMRRAIERMLPTSAS